jgi:hypothetical protein
VNILLYKKHIFLFFSLIIMYLKEAHMPFVNRSGIFDWEQSRLEAEYRVKLFPPRVSSLQGPSLYGSPSTITDPIYYPALISQPELHRDHVATNYRLIRPMPSSYHCLLDPSRRLAGLDDNNTTIRFDQDSSFSYDTSNNKQPEFTWYHNNETELGKILPENYWNRHKLAGTSHSGYLVPTVL